MYDQGDFPGGPVAKTPWSQYRGSGSISGQGSRSHMLQLRVPVVYATRSHVPYEDRQSQCRNEDTVQPDKYSNYKKKNE